MNSSFACAVVIPCLNEEKAILPLVQAVRGQIPEVIVVDDGSTDATAQLAKQAGARVLRHEKPRGKGAALNTGWRDALARGFDWALAMDGDGQHAPEDISKFLSAAGEDKADLIVGNRFADATTMPWLRHGVNRWMSARLSRAAGVSLPDSQCGFRMMRLRAWSRLELETQHFEVESEMLLSFIAKGFSVDFIPVRTIYAAERSKINPVHDTVRWFRWWRRVSSIADRPAISLSVREPKESLKI